MIEIDWTLALTLFTGIIVPLGAVLVGWWLANWRTDKKESRNEQIQRIKLLHMLRYELETTIAHYNEHKKYYSRETMTGKLIIQSALFNVDDHSELLTKLWEYLRGFQALNVTIETLPTLINPMHFEAISQGKQLINRIFNPNITNETYEEALIKTKEAVDESTRHIIDAAIPLFAEVEKLIKLEKERLD